jgi:hypothetical protein
VKLKLLDMSNEALVQRFAEICVEQDDALLGDEIERFNELYEQKSSINVELKERGISARLGLMKLYEHPNMQVKLQAAKATLAVAPIEARRMIEWIADSKWMPQAGDAGMCLLALDEGIFKPT